MKNQKEPLSQGYAVKIAAEVFAAQKADQKGG